MNQAAINKAMGRIERAMAKKHKNILDVIREQLEKVYEVGYIHGKYAERARVRELLGI